MRTVLVREKVLENEAYLDSEGALEEETPAEESGYHTIAKSQQKYLMLKRVIDVVLSSLGLIILAIPMGIIAIAIKIEDPGPVIFKQKRIGIHKSYFSIYKFRSMKVATPDIPTHLMTHPEQYITKVGRFIRKTSLDELPQMWNILKGDMSIIGPRPVLWSEYDLIAERDKYGANDVKPGLTGWAQINGRDELENPVKAKLDGDYVKHMGFGMDLRCFFGSILAVLKGDGVVEGGTGEMKKEEDQAENKNGLGFNM